ncbi:hypothetical protein LEP1GSC123_3842 [Leptospira borgpetersenii str. 200701203]|uniref:Uncharacterized protein n=1 Tax=Leptospira borgpetersenii str. 200701203 TaxID=1193007 RepID=M3GK25_LEPBO|nr:hypothetical protein LEP1GSC123_3842 [Leptospira borgpetersenii str. 200701203]
MFYPVRNLCFSQIKKKRENLNEYELSFPWIFRKNSRVRMAIPEFSYHCLEYRSFTPRMLNSHAQRKISGYFLFHLFRRIRSFFFYSASQKPSLLCQKDQAARFCPSFGTGSYKVPCLKFAMFFKKSTSEFSGKK